MTQQTMAAAIGGMARGHIGCWRNVGAVEETMVTQMTSEDSGSLMTTVGAVRMVGLLGWGPARVNRDAG
ncbi:MAG: hypothetical protein ACRDLT_07055 [Solirubrobacteraceae bacterium]